MESQGIRISDKINRVISVKLIDILSEVPKGNFLYWSILFLDVMQKPDGRILLSSFQNQILKFPRGLFVNWDDISLLAQDTIQIIDIVILGCKNQNSWNDNPSGGSKIRNKEPESVENWIYK